MAPLPRTGDLRWDRRRGGRWQRWSGRRWSVAAYSVAPRVLLAESPSPASRPELSAHARETALRSAVSAEVLGGATVLQQDRLSAILAHRRRVSHVGHAVLTLLTGGLWGIVWVVMAIARRDDRVRLDVDAQGHVWPTEHPG